MSNYRRLISYIYAYEGGIKGKNIGFAKIEIRGEQCRIHVSVKKVYVGSNDIGVYLLSPKVELLLGRIFIRNGCGEFRIHVNSSDVEGSGLNMDECYGLTIHDVESAWQCYTTIWDDAVTQAAETTLEDVTSSNVVRPMLEGQKEITADKLPIAKEIERELQEEEMRLQMVKPWNEEPVNVVQEQRAESETQNQEPVQECCSQSKAETKVQTELNFQAGALMQSGSEIQTKSAVRAGAVVHAESVVPTELSVHEASVMQTEPALHKEPAVPTESSLHEASVMQTEPALQREPAVLTESSLHEASVMQTEPALHTESAAQTESALHAEPVMQTKPALHTESAAQTESALHEASVMQTESALRAESAVQTESALHTEPVMQTESTLRAEPVIQAEQNRESYFSGPEDLEKLKELDRLEQEQKTRNRLWDQLQSRYAKVLAFDYDKGCEILSIKPQDIGLLPRDIWVYGNNSFLLHGFYNYRHLILAKLNNPEGNPRYLLGVPGHYFSNEKYMASMFGFPHFVLARKQPEEDGRFGYWYTDIRL